MIRWTIVLMALLIIAAPIAAEQANEKVTQPQNGTFTGIHRNQGVLGQTETVTITDGRSFVRLTEQEYRAGGYWPPYEKLSTIFVQRLPVRVPVPSDEELPER